MNERTCSGSKYIPQRKQLPLRLCERGGKEEKLGYSPLHDLIFLRLRNYQLDIRVIFKTGDDLSSRWVKTEDTIPLVK